MTVDEIRKLEVGPKLDKLVSVWLDGARKPLQPYSTDIRLQGELHQKMEANGYEYRAAGNTEKKIMGRFVKPGRELEGPPEIEFSNNAGLAQLHLCHAVLIALMAQQPAK